MGEEEPEKTYGCGCRERLGSNISATDKPLYKGFLEYDEEDEFYGDLLDTGEGKRVLIGQWKTELVTDSGKFKDEHCYGCGLPCEGDELKIKRALGERYEISCMMEGIFECPRCGAFAKKAFKKRSDKPVGATELFDVRLKGHTTKVIVHKKEKWTCPKCYEPLTGLRIPIMQQVKKGTYTLRLLKSMYQLTIDGETGDYIVEGYGLPRSTAYTRIGEYKKFVAAYYEGKSVEAIAQAASEGALHIEIITIKGKHYQVVCNKRDRRFYVCIEEYKPPKETIRISYCTSGRVGMPMEKKQASMAMICGEVQGLPILRYRLLLLLEELDVIMAVVELDRRSLIWFSVEQEMRNFYHRIASFKPMKKDDLQRIREILCNLDFYRIEHDYETRGLKETHMAAVQKGAELLDFIDDCMYIREDLWDRELNMRTPQYHNRMQSECESKDGKEVAEFIEAFKAASAESPYKMKEQLARLQYLNEPSLWDRGSNDGMVLRNDGMPELENTALGKGIPIACLTYLLRNGLLQGNGQAPRCITDKLKQKQGCSLDCPFLRG